MRYLRIPLVFVRKKITTEIRESEDSRILLDD
nr:MAG TPA: hypothetical protein [Caudoviricetes sp.]